MKNKSIEEILTYTIKECIQFFRNAEDGDFQKKEEGDFRARKELMLMDVLVERLKNYGHLDEKNFKELKHLIWEFAMEVGWTGEMPEF
jgi:hypothetical protein